MRHRSPNRTDKLKQALLHSKLQEQRAKTGAQVMTEDGFKAKLAAMSYTDCIDYALAVAAPKTPEEVRACMQDLQGPFKNLMGELAEDMLNAYRHDLEAGFCDHAGFIAAFKTAMEDPDSYEAFWARRGLRRTFRLHPDGRLSG